MPRTARCLIALVAPAVLLAAGAPPQADLEAVVLGIAQDGGVPHAGCSQKLCAEARADPSKRRLVAALGVLDRKAGKRFLIDATPDFTEQTGRLGGLPDAILLTHAHIGHYLGLAQLGREAANTRELPVYATASLASFLRTNRPWSRLVERHNVVLREIEPGREFALTDDLRATAIRVPHRDEDSDTVAYFLSGPRGRILWLPDIDRWESWDRKPEDFAADPKLTAFLDGTFFEAAEIPGRSIADIPHPLIPQTAARLGVAGRPAARVIFVHLNHTNRLLWDADAVRALEARGFEVAREGLLIPF